MSSTAKELVECATMLLCEASNEPQFRTVCSRAYYGAFHAADAFHRALRAPGTIGNANGRHEQLISQLSCPMIHWRDQNYAVSRAIGKALRTLRDARVTADYQLTDPVSRALAEKSAAIAMQILETTT